MSEIYIPLFSALIGTIIGGGVSILTVWVQTRAANKKRRWDQAFALALEDWRLHKDVVERQGGEISPLSLYLAHFLELVDAVDADKLTPEAIREMARRTRELESAIREADAEWRADRPGGKQA